MLNITKSGGKRQTAGDCDLPGGAVRLSFPVYYVRHGQTDWNKERRFQGHTDIPLNARGRRQAARNGDALAGVLHNPQTLVCWASPLSRARETMEIIRERLGLARDGYGCDDRLKEIDLGDWNGKTPEEIDAADPGVFEARERDKWAFQVPGGESYADAATRTRAFLVSLRRPCLIAGHGGAGRLLRGYLTGASRASLPDLRAPQDRVFRLSGGQETEI